MAGKARLSGGAQPAATLKKKSAARGAATSSPAKVSSTKASSTKAPPNAPRVDDARLAIARALLPPDTSALSPLDVMLMAMRAHCSGEAPDLDKAASIAKSIAPYVHPRFASIDPPGGEEEQAEATRPGPSARELARAILAIIARAKRE